MLILILLLFLKETARDSGVKLVPEWVESPCIKLLEIPFIPAALEPVSSMAELETAHSEMLGSMSEFGQECPETGSGRQLSTCK